MAEEVEKTEKVEKKNKSWFGRHKILTVLLALIALGVIVSATDNKKTTSNTSQSASSKTTAKTDDKKLTTAKLNEAVRDGKFEFVVKSITCGKSNVGSDYTTKTAQGQYCLLDVTVKNIGTEAQSLFSGNQYLYNASGSKYSADDTATLYAAPTTSSWYSNINPGNSVEGVIVFDLPKDQTPASAELHDSALSSGVKVNLQ